MRRHLPATRNLEAGRRSILRGEGGFAMAAVVILGFFLIALSSLVVLRGVRAIGNTSGDARWERALPSAESGLEAGLLALEVNANYSTVATYPAPFATPEQERDWAVAAAGAVPFAQVTSTPVGQYVVVKPASVNLLYAVGYAPGRDAFGHRTRVVRIGYELHPVAWELDYALLVGDDLLLGGNTLIQDANGYDNANTHANGAVDTQGSWEVEGCVTSSETALDPELGCPQSPVDLELIPRIDPRVLYPFAEVVLCPGDGLAYGGPAHPDPAKRDANNVPCDAGGQQVPLAEWTSKSKGGVRTWDPSKVTGSGVYYVHQANVDGKITGSYTLLISAVGAGACTGKATGSLSLAGNSFFATAPSMLARDYDIAVVAEGDIYYRGGATIQGAILAQEQIDYRGNADSWGAVVAKSACDTNGSPVSKSAISQMSGGSYINYPGLMKTPFISLRMESEVISWHEL